MRAAETAGARAALAVIGLAGCSVLLIEATRVADPASVGVVIGAAPLVIVIAAALAAGRRPTRRALLAAAVVTAGSAAAQLGGATGPTWSAPWTRMGTAVRSPSRRW